MILDVINEQYKTILSHMQDEESVRILNDRIEYMITRNQEELERKLFDTSKRYECKELENALQSELDRPIIIFGCGIYGITTKRNLEYCQIDYNVVAFCDNNKELIGKTIEGISVISPEDVLHCENPVIIVTFQKHSKEICSQLVGMGIDKKDIVAPTLGYPEIQCGWQYFDLFKPDNNEIFVDAGTFDGSTIIEYYKWLGDRNGKCYGLEPVKEMYESASKLVVDENIMGTSIYNAAAWNCNEELHIMIDQKADGEIWGGSAVSDSGVISVAGRSIDSILEENDSGVTFIKMDIEGSELKALEGAKNSIIKYKPKLAISVYHKPMDILEIPDYILSLVGDYKFFIRHYSGNQNETILYATL